MNGERKELRAAEPEVGIAMSAISVASRRIVAFGTFALLAFAGRSSAQVGDGAGESPSDAELRKRLEPLVPSFRAALLGDNVESQRATLAVIADIPPSLAARTNLNASLSTFLQKDHKDPEVLALAIRSFGRSVPAYGDADMSKAIAAELGKLLSKYVRSEYSIVRQAVAEAIGSAITNATPSVWSAPRAEHFIAVCLQAAPLLGTGIEDKSGATARIALKVIQSISRNVNELFTYYNDPIGAEPGQKDGETRFPPIAPVIQAIAKEVPKLAVPLSAGDSETQTAAARTLETLAVLRAKILERQGPGAAKDNFAAAWPVLSPVLAQRVKDPNASVRLATTEALESLGDAIEARSFMREATADSNIYVRWAAVRALGKSASASPDLKSAAPDVAALTNLVDDKDLDVRTAALVALAKFGSKAKSASTKVLGAANRGDIEPRVMAVKALGAIESDVSATVPVLIEGLKHSDDRLRKAAASGLVRFGPDAREALPELRKALQSQDPELRLAAAEAILAIERTARLKDL